MKETESTDLMWAEIEQVARSYTPTAEYYKFILQTPKEQ